MLRNDMLDCGMRKKRRLENSASQLGTPLNKLIFGIDQSIKACTHFHIKKSACTLLHLPSVQLAR